MNDLTQNILKLIFWLSLTATLYTYFLYPLLLMTLTRILRPRRRDQATQSTGNDILLPYVTMIISAYNEEATLPEKIANCIAIDYPPDKISFLIGSDGSDDSTRQILRNISDPRFLTLHNPIRAGKVQMLNQLTKLATGDIIVFSDANTMYQPDAVRQLIKPFERKNVGCVIGKLELTPAAADPDACRPEGLYWRYENRIKQMESILGAVPTINGGIFAIRRHLYQIMPAHTITEDQVLGMKIMTRGYRCLFADSAIARESVSNFKGELRRRIRISAGNFQSLFLVPAIMNPRCGRISFAFISHKLLRWLVPFFLAAMLLANILLVGELFYGSTLLLQTLFYISGIISMALPKLGYIPKVLAVPKYFIAMNFAIIIGLTRFLTHRQQVTWKKAPRR